VATRARLPIFPKNSAVGFRLELIRVGKYCVTRSARNLSTTTGKIFAMASPASVAIFSKFLAV